MIEKKFRAWPHRDRIPNGYDIDDPRSYFDEDEMDALHLGYSSEELDRERKAFGRYVYDERRRIERKPAEPRPKQPPVAVRTGHGYGHLNAPRRVGYSCSRYWFYSHVIPIGANRPHLHRDTAQRTFGLHDSDMAKWCPNMPWELCAEAADRAARGVYPRAGIPAAMAERIGLDASMRWRREMSYYPPAAVLRLVDPIDLSLGLSVWYERTKGGPFKAYSWDITHYAEGPEREQKRIREIVNDEADYKSRLLAIFD